MEYKIVESKKLDCDACSIESRLESFNKKVNELCKDGWVPQGPVTILPFSSSVRSIGTVYLLQTMVKHNCN